MYWTVVDYIHRLRLEDQPMTVYVATAAAVALSIVWIYSKATKKCYKLPPGPRPLPLVGNLIELYLNRNDSFGHLERIRRKYGDIYTIYIGTVPTVIVNNAELLREAFIRKGDVISGRLNTYTSDLMSDNGSDILMAQPNEMWKTQRKIMHGAIRKYATGTQFETLVTNSVGKITDMLEEKGSNPVDIERLLSLLVYNIIATMTMGKQFELDDVFFTTIIEKIDYLNDIAGNGLAADYIPLFKYIPTKAQREFKEFLDFIFTFLRDALREHKETYNSDSVTDFTYHLLKMQEEVAEEEESTVAQMTDVHLVQLMSDLLLAGTDTTRMTLSWIVIYLVLYPEVQKKLQTEIHDVLGSSAQVTMADRERLPYVYAVIHEVMRLRPIGPFYIPHVAREDTTLAGYDIPSGAMVTASAMSVHADPKEWEDPDEFKPERFLDSDGQFVTHPGWLPFSAGKRTCVGESLAKPELLMVVTLLFRRFSFHPAQEAPPTTAFKPIAFALIPKPYKVLVKRVED